jgi:hypothetical protein
MQVEIVVFGSFKTSGPFLVDAKHGNVKFVPMRLQARQRASQTLGEQTMRRTRRNQFGVNVIWERYSRRIVGGSEGCLENSGEAGILRQVWASLSGLMFLVEFLHQIPETGYHRCLPNIGYADRVRDARQPLLAERSVLDQSEQGVGMVRCTVIVSEFQKWLGQPAMLRQIVWLQIARGHRESPL